MIEFKKIESPHEPLLEQYYKLYESSFPPEERRSRQSFEKLLGKDERFFPCLVLEQGVFIGFFNYWFIDDFCFGEHFAIRNDIREKQYGTRVMEKFLETVGDCLLIFEVEKPDTVDAKRRIAFYERFEMYPLEKEYAQPLYGDPQKLLPLLLMTNKPDYATKNFETIKASLYREIYEVELVPKN